MMRRSTFVSKWDEHPVIELTFGENSYIRCVAIRITPVID
jgi:hypothetical protein